MKVDLGTLADLFSITYQRTGSIEGGLRVVLAALEVGNAGTRLRVSLREDGPRRRAEVAACQSTIEAVAREEGITVRELKGRDTSPHITRARFKAYYRLSREGRSLRVIAAALKRVSHTTISAGIRRLQREGRA